MAGRARGPGRPASGDASPGGWRAALRRWTRRAAVWLVVLGAAGAARVLVLPARALLHGCRPGMPWEALTTALGTFSVFVLAWAAAGFGSRRGALRRWTLVAQVASAAIAAANLAVAVVCR